MTAASKQTRQNPELKREVGERLREVVQKSGLDASVISFRCGWTARSRIHNYMNGYRTPGAQELIELDRVMYPVLGEYVSDYILHGDKKKESNSDFQKTELNLGAVNRAFSALINDYVEMGRLIAEPKLTTPKMLDDFNQIYLKRELSDGDHS